MTLGGPIWNRPLHDTDFVTRLLHKLEENNDCSLRTADRIKGVLGGILDEEPLKDRPLSYNFHDVCSNLRVSNPDKTSIRNAF